MSLSAREQQALSSIEDRLSRADPRLACMLGIFTRLTRGEDMPARERVRRSRWPRRPRRRQRHSRLAALAQPARRLVLLLAQQRVGLMLWAAVASVLIAAGLVAGHAGRPRPCVARWVAACAGQVPQQAGSRLPARLPRGWPALTRPPS